MKNILNKENKNYLIIFSVLIFLLIITSIFNIKNIPFLVISLFTNLFIIFTIRNTKRILKIDFSKKEKIVIICSIIILYLFYTISILSRKFIYYWDFSCYYNIQLTTIEKFNTSFMEGARYFVGSTWSGEYGNFLTFIPQVLFNFTNKSINSYLISNTLIIIPYLVTSFMLFAKSIKKVLKIKDYKFELIMLVLFLITPLLHSTFILGQPDIFGLALIFLIISLTINYNFKKLEYDRLFFILISSFLLLIARRWYFIWMCAYYLCYVIKLLFENYKEKYFKTMIKHILIYGLFCLIFFFITLYPLFKVILFGSYGSYSTFYLENGLFGEFLSQIKRIGLVIFLIMLIGICYGIYNKKYRLITIFFLAVNLIIIYIFTRVQNMGEHHSLTLIPSYIFYVMLAYKLIHDKVKNTKFEYLLIVFFILNFILSINNISLLFFSNIKLKIENDKDYKSIGRVVDYLNKIVDGDNEAYLITHNNMYNPDKLRNYYTPNSKLSKCMPYGSAIIGVHKFPTELFTAKYVLTTTPYEETSVDGKYNQVFLNQVSKGKFIEKKNFKMNKIYNITIYERIEKVDNDEVKEYIKVLEKESKEYPQLYIDVLKGYLN